MNSAEDFIQVVLECYIVVAAEEIMSMTAVEIDWDGKVNSLARLIVNMYVRMLPDTAPTKFTSNSYNTPARDTLHLYDRARGPQARGRGHTNAMYPAAGVLSTYLCDNEWAYQRRAPMRMLSRLHLVVKKKAMEDRRLRKGTLSMDLSLRLKYLNYFSGYNIWKSII